MEKTIGIIIGGVVALITLAVIFLVAGSAIIGAITALLTIPIAAPLTSILVILTILVGYFVYRKKKASNKDDP